MSDKIGRHANARITERLQMSVGEVIRLLEREQYVLLGQEASTHRVHKLFFSSFDENWFVAVQDERNGFVVTIFPYNYHNRWIISSEALRSAKHLVEGGSELAPLPSTKSVVQILEESNQAPPTVFRFSATFQSSTGAIKTMNLGCLPKREGETLGSVVSNVEVLEWVHEKVRKNRTKESTLVYVAVRLGSKSDVPVLIKPHQLYG